MIPMVIGAATTKTKKATRDCTVGHRIYMWQSFVHISAWKLAKMPEMGCPRQRQSKFINLAVTELTRAARDRKAEQAVAKLTGERERERERARVRERGREGERE